MPKSSKNFPEKFMKILFAILLSATQFALANNDATTPLRDPGHLNFARGFYEIAPRIIKVEVKMGEPFVEVFVSGELPEEGCYEKKEYIVEPLKSHTQIIARFRKDQSGKNCQKIDRVFYEKIADLDPAQSSSKKVEVLGFEGWIEGTLDEPLANVEALKQSPGGNF